MKKSKIAKWIAGAGASLAFALTLLISSLGGGILGLKNKGDTASDNVITAEAATTNITYPDGASELGRFANGYSYVFSDKDKIAGYRGRTLDTDMTTVTVDSSAAAGSQK
ncbi:MAG: hypothetical protein HDP28_03570, partial [Clostridia bacterium]|nr:hypothetical protein [Clostridia bacterium]